MDFYKAGFKAKNDDKNPAETADNLRRLLLESLDFGSTYILGSAKFRLQSVGSPQNIEGRG